MSGLKERYDRAVADVVSAVDVAQIFAEAARSFAKDAQNCLNQLLAHEQALKKAAEKKTDDATPPAFVTNSGDVKDDDGDKVPAFVKNSGFDDDGSAKVTDSSAAVSVPAKVTKTPQEKRKKNSVADLYKTKETGGMALWIQV